MNERYAHRYVNYKPFAKRHNANIAYINACDDTCKPMSTTDLATMPRGSI